MCQQLKIDIHTHVIPEHLPDWAGRFGYGGFIDLVHHQPGCARMMKDGQFFREIQENCWDPSARLKECAASGIQVQVLSTIPVLFAYHAQPAHGWDVSRFLNDHLASLQDLHPKRFISLGTVPLQDPELAIREMERCRTELGLPGVEIGSNVNGLNLDEERFFPFFQAAADTGMAVFVHPWEMLGRDRLKKYWTPWLVGMPAETCLAICSVIFSGLLEKLPRLRIAFAHGGGSFPMTLGRIQHGFQVRPDLVAVDNPVSPEHYVGKFWIDSLVHDPAVLRFLLGMFGKEKIALGSDYPFPLGELQPGSMIEQMDLDPLEKEYLFSRSALEWLHLEQERFAA